jgi:hypothetical protein
MRPRLPFTAHPLLLARSLCSPLSHLSTCPPFYPLQSYDASEFESLAGKYEKLNWRIIAKPGGATVKPDDFYSLYGYHMQASITGLKSLFLLWESR